MVSWLKLTLVARDNLHREWLERWACLL